MEPLYDIICILIQTPFSRFSDFDKKLILSEGRPTPIITETSFEKRSEKSGIRSFKSSWYKKINWLCGSIYKQKMYCWPCLLFSNIKNVWNYDGYRDYKNLTRGLQAHTTSREHIRCHMALQITKKNKNTIQDQDALRENALLGKKAYNITVRKNRLILEHLIDVTILLAKQELPFTSQKEIFHLLIKRNPELTEHMKKIENFTDGQCDTIPNELIACVETYLLEYIRNEILQSTFISLQVVDATETSQYSLILRYVTSYGKIKERFMGFYASDSRTAESLFSVIDRALTPLNYKEKLVAHCYDGAAVAVDEVNDLQSKINTVAPVALFTHCCAHKLNLVLQQGSCCIDEVRFFFATVISISHYFYKSGERSWFLDEILKGRSPHASTTRWITKSEVINLVVTEFEKFVLVFKLIQNNKSSSAESINGASGFLYQLESFINNFLAAIFYEIFNITDPLLDILQNKCLDVTCCSDKISVAITKIQNLRNENNFEKIYVDKLKFIDQSTNLKEHKLENKLLYFKVLDNIIAHMNTRFSDIINYKFLALVDFSKSLQRTKNQFPEKDLKSLFKYYPNIFDSTKLKNELIVIYNTQYFQNNVSLEVAMDYVIKNDLQDVFSEFYKLLSLILTIPSTSVCVERNFSVLKRIQYYFRNTMRRERLSGCGLISLEKELLTELSEKEEFYDDIINIFANMEECQIDLLYK